MKIASRATRTSLALLAPMLALVLVGACGSDSESSSDRSSDAEEEMDASAAGGTDDGSGTDANSSDGPGGTSGEGETSGSSGTDPISDEIDGTPAAEGLPVDGADASAPSGDAPVEENGGTSLLPTGDGGTTLPDFVDIATNADGTIEILCNGDPCACSDGEDNDGDGLVDGLDSECTSPFDDDEATFATGIPGDNSDPKWQDCFFDGNSGAGDDGCRYHTDCLTGDLPEDDPDCVITEQCKEYCEPLTPPGCDCFGCCEVDTGDGEMVHILVGETCSLDIIDDEEACPRCEPTGVCENECGECEICIGQTFEDLPDSCWPEEQNPPTGSGGSGNTGSGGSPGTEDPPGSGGTTGSGGSSNDNPPDQTDPPVNDPPPPNVCDGGLTACFDSTDCAADEFCSLGCCQPVFRVR